MIKHKLKMGLMGLSLLTILVGCSNDDTQNTTATEESGVIENTDIKLTYGSNLLNSYMSVRNSKIAFERISGSNTSQAVIKALNSVNNYQQPDLTGAIALTGSGWHEITSGKKYYIPENTTFTGGINFNGAGILIILGTLGGSNWVNVPNGGRVEVAPNGIISTANLHLNGGSVLDNYGKIEYRSGTVDGTINNYNELVFTSQYINLNGSSLVNNNCSLVFNGSGQINANLNNNGYIDFKQGFHINGSGNLVLGAGSLTDLTGGTITIDGKIKNENSGFARIDLNGASFGNMNATPAFIGKIDINGNQNLPNNKVDNQVVQNGNTYIAANGCMPQRGLAACNDDLLQFTLAATVGSPDVNGTTLSATDVRVEDGRAYVSYHTNDEVYGDAPNGSIRIFNVQNHQAPSLIAQAEFNNAEFNGIDVEGNRLYAVGGNKAGARLITTPLSGGMFNTNDLSVFQAHKVPSISAKNSFMYGNMLWLVSGATGGGFFKLNPSNNYEVSEQLYTDGARAKYVAQNGRYQVFFAVEAGGAYLRVANIDGSSPQVYQYSSLSQTVNNGKNVIAMDDDYVYVALSDKGVAKIQLNNGELIHQFTPNDYRVNDRKVFRENGYTNGVAINDCYLYLANGADGVIVLNKDSFNVVGSFKLSESANYVYAKDGLLFVATGRSGLNIVKIN